LQTRTAKKRLPPFFGFGLPHAPKRSLGLDGKNTVIGETLGKAATVSNEHIATIAALPSFENNC